MKRKLLLSGIMGCLSLGMLSAQDFHLQPTPQVYETSQDSIALPLTYALSADQKLEDSPALLLLENYCLVRLKRLRFASVSVLRAIKP